MLPAPETIYAITKPITSIGILTLPVLAILCGRRGSRWWSSTGAVWLFIVCVGIASDALRGVSAVQHDRHNFYTQPQYLHLQDGSKVLGTRSADGESVTYLLPDGRTYRLGPSPMKWYEHGNFAWNWPGTLAISGIVGSLSLALHIGAWRHRAWRERRRAANSTDRVTERP